ncbi:MAG: alanine racemase [Bryobacterales bacterium]|nr:alanine racemase [Bryobacterales bacterium]
MNSRRRFLSLTAAGAVASSAWAARRAELRFNEVEARIARRDFRDLTREDLGTPALILDEEIFNRNIRHMAEHSKSVGINVRPHVKIHKCPEVSKRQVALGAIGVCCATIAEAELFSASGIKGVLWTCQPAGRNKIQRTADLAKKDPTFRAVVDDPRTVDLLEEAAAAVNTKVNVVVDCWAGLERHGCPTGEPALALAKKVDQAKHLKFAGVMGYSGAASHTKGWENRRKKSQEHVVPMVATAEMCRKAGLNVEIITGGSTGTYNIDKEFGLTELQAGSFVFMDTAYIKIGNKSGDAMYSDFGTALTVLTTVISRNHRNIASIDAGNKAMLKPTDAVKGRPDVVVKNQGAEYGLLTWTSGPEIGLGDLVEIYPSNLDMSVNVYDRIYVARGEKIVDMWPIMGRAGAPQR